ncbi:MAG: ThuA domain-containing protein [Acidobacteria bacterium]|nr:ThuA domain-containing protein [Acidobacteriota bacterium]
MPNDSFTVKVDDPKSPLNKVFKGRGFEITEEVFQFQEPGLRQRLRVLLSIDMAKSKPARPVLPIRQKDQDFPMSWIRAEGQGRVYYSALGHNPHLFWNAALLEHFLAGLQYALGDLKADARPR